MSPEMHIPMLWRTTHDRMRLAGSNCPHCGIKHMPGRPICPDCGRKSTNLSIVSPQNLEVPAKSNDPEITKI